MKDNLVKILLLINIILIVFFLLHIKKSNERYEEVLEMIDYYPDTSNEDSVKSSDILGLMQRISYLEDSLEKERELALEVLEEEEAENVIKEELSSREELELLTLTRDKTNGDLLMQAIINYDDEDLEFFKKRSESLYYLVSKRLLEDYRDWSWLTLEFRNLSEDKEVLNKISISMKREDAKVSLDDELYFTKDMIKIYTNIE